MGESRRENLISCVKDHGKCLGYLQMLKSEFICKYVVFDSIPGKQLTANVAEIIQELNGRQLDQLWTYASKLCVEALAIISSGLNQEYDEMIDVQNKVNEENAAGVLEMICILLSGSVNGEEPKVVNGMLQCIQLLHGSLFDLHDIQPTLAHCICKVCVEWWKKNLRCRENLCLNAITLLLRICPGSRKNKIFPDVCSMQDCLSLFDFQSKLSPSDEEEVHSQPGEEKYAEAVIEELYGLLVKSFQRVSILEQASGRKFLSFALLQKDLMRDLHVSVMESVGHKYSLMKAEAIGNIYFLCWRLSQDEKKTSFEEICIQDLMFRAVHAPCAENQDLFSSYRKILFALICHKSSVELRHMISRLYGPILWRSLQSANAMVRANSARLLLDAFPMEEAKSDQLRVAEEEKFMQQQYDALNSLLSDTCPKIRVIGILGIAEMLCSYWDVVPAHVINTLLQRVYNDLAFDAAINVRQAVFKGTIKLLNTPFAHPILAKLLPPCMGRSIHDIAEKVRIAVADVLLSVTQTSTISFYNVCPVENIIAQLETDGMPVSKRLVKLLSKSFIPKDKSVKVWVERCVKFFEKNINAARKFFLLIAELLTVQEVGEFLHMIGVFVYNCVSNRLQQEQNSELNESQSMPLNDQSNVDSSQVSERVVGDDVLCAVLDTSCILWNSFQKKGNRELMKKVMQTFAKTIHICFKIANDERMLNALFVLSSKLPPASIPVFSKSVIPKLRSLSGDAPYSYCSMLIKCVCCWDWTKQLLEMLNEWLSQAVSVFKEGKSVSEESSDTTNRTPKRSERQRVQVRRSTRQSSRKENEPISSQVQKKTKTKKKAVSFQEKTEYKPDKALKYLKAFLDVQSKCSYKAFRNPSWFHVILSITKTLHKCQQEISSRLPARTSSNSNVWPDNLLVEAFTVRCQLLTILYHIQHKADNDSDFEETVNLLEFESIISWFCGTLEGQESANQTLVNLNTSVISDEARSTNLLAQLSLYRQVFTSSLKSILEFMSCGVSVFSHVENAILLFCQSDVNRSEYFSVLIQIILELHENQSLKNFTDVNNNKETSANAEQGTKEQTETKISVIFDHLIAALLKQARKSPESYSQLFKQDLRTHVRKLVREQRLIHSVRPEYGWYDIMVKQVISAVVTDLMSEIKSSHHLLVLNHVSEMPAFSSSIIPTMCSTAEELAYVCDNAITPLAKDELADSDKATKLAQPFALLLHALQGGKYKNVVDSCSSALSVAYPSLQVVLDKLKKGRMTVSDETPLSEGWVVQTEKDREEIVVLENPDDQDMFINDEELVL